MKFIEKLLWTFGFIGMIICVAILFVCYNTDNKGIFSIDKYNIISYNNNLYVVRKENPKNYHINNIVAYVNKSNDIKVGTIDDGYTTTTYSSFIYSINDDIVKDNNIIGGCVFSLLNVGGIYNFVFRPISIYIFGVLPLSILCLYEFILLIKSFKRK